MNTRIQELAEQAGLIPGIMGLNRFTYFDPEKFAELIIERCATVADFAHLGGVVEPGAMVREYFGVDNEKV